MFRNLFHIFRRFKMASLLNVLGLSIAFASFIIIMMQVLYETGYNSSYKDADKIFRAENIINKGSEGGFLAVNSWPLGRSLATSPHVKYVAAYSPMQAPSLLTIKEGESVKTFDEICVEISEDYPKLFSFDMVEGDTDALKNGSNMLIPQSLAKKYFAGEPALGKAISTDKGKTYFVGGVYRDFPRNTTTQNFIYTLIDETKVPDTWSSQSYYFFVLLDSPESADGLFASIIDHLDYHSEGYDSKEAFLEEIDLAFRLTNIRDIYYTRDVQFDFGETGSRQTTFLLICIAFIILIIAGINFTNFSTALTPMRIKSINTQKVLGSSVSRLRFSLLMEAVCIAFVSFLVSLLIVYMCRGTFIESMLSPELAIVGNIPLIIGTAAISIVTGVLAGLYPSFYLTSFSPALVLKGSFGLSKKGRHLRSVLLCMQYVASIVLLVVSAFMILQNKYMLNTSFGYDKDQIVTVILTDEMKNSYEAVANELKANENIEATATAMTYISCMDDNPLWAAWFIDRQIQYHCLMVSPDFLKVLGIKVTEGRDFLDTDLHRGGSSTYIFNQTAKEQYKLNVGDDLQSGIVAGFVNDIKYSSFRRVDGPMALMVIDRDDEYVYSLLSTAALILYVRIAENAPYDQTIEHIRSTLKKFEPLATVDVKHLNESIEEAYRKEKNLSSLITVFSIMAILISIVGIFGLVIFETQYKRKEIGVRKVFGSTTSEIMGIFNAKYVRMILLCTVIAAPISYYIVSEWLATFTHRTPIHWWVFVLAFLAISIITLVTISWQNFKAASANPIESLKTE